MTETLGIGGHHSARSRTDTWLTPPELIQALGPFDLDPCAAPLPRPWPTALTHYTWPLQDGLTLPFFGRVWMNPPYGRALGAWLGRLAEHGTGTALVFARTETDAFFRYVWERADAVMFLRGRLSFHYPDGRRARNGGAPSLLIAHGPEDVERLLASGLDGAVVPLNRPTMIHLAIAHDPPMPLWREIVADAMRDLGGRVSLAALYAALEDHPKARANPHWRAKIRQTAARVGNRIAAGQYELALAS
jgi:hypothetical protein